MIVPFRSPCAFEARPEVAGGAIDSLVLSRMAPGAIPGLALAVTHNGRILYTSGYGTARRRPPSYAGPWR
jgi:hypothetical protein